jgi:hypothetical protein
VTPWATPGGDMSAVLDVADLGTQSLNQVISVDVTMACRHEQACHASNAPVRGFALTDMSGAAPYVFTAESPIAEQRPYLHVVIPEPMAAVAALVLVAVVRVRGSGSREG